VNPEVLDHLEGVADARAGQTVEPEAVELADERSSGIGPDAIKLWPSENFP
jgi:hypothetical protein